MVTVSGSAEKVAERRAAIAPLKARAHAAGVTQDAIAEKLGCTRPFVVNVFAGRRRPPDGFVPTVEAMCEARERRAMKRKAS